MSIVLDSDWDWADSADALVPVTLLIDRCVCVVLGVFPYHSAFVGAESHTVKWGSHWVDLVGLTCDAWRLVLVLG